MCHFAVPLLLQAWAVKRKFRTEGTNSHFWQTKLDAKTPTENKHMHTSSYICKYLDDCQEFVYFNLKTVRKAMEE